MTANATHTGRITIPGTDVGVKGTLVAEPQTENMLLSLSDRLALGPVKVDTDPSGALESPGLVVPIVSGVLWLLRFEPHRHDVPPFVMGVYNLNTSGVDLKDLVIAEVTGITETDRLNIAAALALGGSSDSATASFVGDTASATVAALRKRETVFSVMDFGAVGDGVTNDATAITAANTAAGAVAAFGPAVVWFPWTPKGYICNSTIGVKDGVTYRGDRRVRLRHTSSTFAYFNSLGVQNWTVENFTLDDSAGLTSASAVYLATGSRRYTVRNVKFVGGLMGKSNPIVSRTVASNVATLTTADPHGLEVGSIAHVSDMPTGYDGDYTVTAVPTSTTFSFALTLANVGATAVYGGWLNGETYRSITHKAVTSNVATFTTSAPHGYTVGQYVWISGVEGENDGGGNGVLSSGLVHITAVPDSTHFSAPPTATGTHPDVATTALTPNGTTGIDTQAVTTGQRQHAIDHQAQCTDGLIEDCWFQGFANNIRIPDVKRIIVQRCRFTNWSNRCFFLISQAAASSEDVWVLNNYLLDLHVGGATRQPIAVQYVSASFPHKRLRIEGNVVIGPGKSWTARDPGTADQISIQCSEDFRIVNNYSAYGGDLGIHGGSSTAHRGVIANNVSVFNDTAGINLGAAASAACSDFLVTDNLVMNNGQNRSGDRAHPTGLAIYGGVSRVTYSGNHIYDDQGAPTQTRGFFLRDATDVLVAESNRNDAPTPYDIDTGCTDIKGLFRTATLLTPLSITNTAGPAAIWTPPVVPVGMFKVGSIFEYDLTGSIDAKAASGNFSVRLAFGAISTGSFSVAASQTGAATNLNWNARVRLIVEALGSSGVVSVTGMNATLGATGVAWTLNSIAGIATTVNLASGINATVSGTMATADPANVLRITRATMRQVA